MATQKVQGTVKWFSNKKGFGFITPVEGSVTDTDVFVHQSSIHSEGYRTLDEGWIVEFEIGDDDGGRTKAENVTAPGGGPCSGPHKRRERNRRRGPKKTPDGDDDDDDGRPSPENGTDEPLLTSTTGTEAAPTTTTSSSSRPPRTRNGRSEGRKRPAKPEAFWHSVLDGPVKTGLEEKGVRTTTGTLDISCGGARVKLGTHGYASVAQADGLLGEGAFVCDEFGKVCLTWEKCLEFRGGEWEVKSGGEGGSGLVTELILSDDKVVGVKPDETALTLWGEKPDPLEALKANGFLMRRVVLTTKKTANSNSNSDKK